MPVTSVVLRADIPCGVCGYRRPLLRFASVRVNAKSLREQGNALVLGPGACDECGWNDRPNSVTMPTFRLDAEDQAKVDAARERLRNRRKAVRA